MKQAGFLAGLGLVSSYLLALIPMAGWVFAIIGLVLFLVGIYKISEITNEKRIFQLFLIPVILGFIATIITLITMASAIASIMMRSLAGLSASMIVLIVAAVIILIVSLVSYVKAYRLLAEVTKMNIFNTVAKLYKWGAILLIVFGVGAILMLVGVIVATVGFFSMEQKQPVQ
ncbi:DUF996 domain-containing protein [Pseudothermotoga sp.]|nr:DUF996 domain-containing protein [Pseudothermotoga sp.]MCX7812458.1 DUF996 domain-containing protein [Pseudothermotoga sp.]MDW8140088.1 DUF996 domain-containing protein [Pseudothermotoga sp.]